MIASTIGTIIIVVAVLDIHMDRNAVATMNPNRMLRGLMPNQSRIRSAIRLWRFQRCIARATKNPPMNRKIMWLKYTGATTFPFMIPSAGNNTTGSNVVTANGIASVIHHTAISSATAAVRVTSGCSGSRSKKSIRQILNTGPPINAVFDTILLDREVASVLLSIGIP